MKVSWVRLPNSYTVSELWCCTVVQLSAAH